MARRDVTDIQVVQAALDYRASTPPTQFVNEILADRTGQPVKVCDRAIERAIGRGLVDCGVSERTCFPTPTGLALIGESGISAEPC